MIFNNCGKSLNDYSFRYCADELENIKILQISWMNNESSWKL